MGVANMTTESVGRPVRITSISFSCRPLEAIIKTVDQEGARGADLMALPETWAGQSLNQPETLDGPIISAMSELARKHKTWIVCPLDRLDGNRRVNSAVLLDRHGEVAGIYDKIYPYWKEFGLSPTVEIGSEPYVFETDFGRVGLAICFDANFPEMWKDLADRGAELVIWPSAYSAGTTLQAHALMNHYPIVTSTQRADCIVYDIDGQEVLYETSDDIHISRITLDLDRGIYHENFNLAARDRLLAEHLGEIEVERHLLREQWFILRATKPGISARRLAREYGLEELRDYVDRSRRQIDDMRARQVPTRPWLETEAGVLSR
jgi:predicted amidohydrolase